MDAKAPFNPIEPGRPSAAPARSPGWRPERCDQIALIFQGGGALGAYQAGVYEALHEANVEPDWVTGVSIGAINAAIIAGNPREERLDKLRAFWQKITDRHVWAYTPDGDIYRQARNATSAMMTMTLGQPGFFKPHDVNPWLSASGAKAATSFYDSMPLADTLREFVDFSLISDGNTRFAVGAVNVQSGNFIYFDNRNETIGPEHIMASGALPPALPMVKIGTDYYWDGGIVSNTPLQHVLEEDGNHNMLIFQVDLFSSRGALPRDIQSVLARQKDITYASRTRYNTDVYRLLRKWKSRTFAALSKVPEELLTDEERKTRDDLARLPLVTILHLIYQQQAYEGEAKDYEFSGTSMREHWKSGYTDTKRTLMRRDYMQMPSGGRHVVIHDVHREREMSD
ncbi:MAG: patatin-like phospholipase family protein [Methylovirgula sp.]